jgi:hypothetical protein
MFYKYFFTLFKILAISTMMAGVLNCNKLAAQLLMSGSLNGHVYSIIDNEIPGAGGNDYYPPSTSEYQEWKVLINTLLNGDYALATLLANSLNYDLIKLIDGSSEYYILQKQDAASNYWGTYVFNPNSCRNIVIQSPHAKKDFNTGKQGVYVFKHANALFYCLTGTNRCNHDSLSSCSGSTTVCSGGASEPYRISDVAHNEGSVFQATTESLKEFDNTSVFIQFHGFTKLSTDPYIIMSNGTRITPVPDYINILANELSIADDTLTFEIAHLNLSWNRLIGFTNTQGRYLNSSISPCNNNADTTIGTFIHVEQEKNRLRLDSTKWDIMVQAVNNSFVCPTMGLSEPRITNLFRWYPNPANQMVTIEFDNPSHESLSLYLHSLQGQCIKSIMNISSNKITIDSIGFSRGVYIVRLCSEDGIRAIDRLIFE